ncbi:hypothetical protein DENSPDRAFT_887294, partial [Dentipellis sp. KUC8613]
MPPRTKKRAANKGKGKATQKAPAAPAEEEEFGPQSYGPAMHKPSEPFDIALYACHRVARLPNPKYPSLYDVWIRDIQFKHTVEGEDKGKLHTGVVDYFIPERYAAHWRRFIFSHRMHVELMEHWKGAGLEEVHGKLRANPIIGSTTMYLENILNESYKILDSH